MVVEVLFIIIRVEEKNAIVIVREIEKRYPLPVEGNRIEGIWMYSKHGITYPSIFNPMIIDALMKTI
ncbi:hypothetical protein [Methanosarcina lacustris]|uniref:hypothetical protein n=1 Tax=Methanosarcina lacustris TaxID=170861 RepID=UPI0012F6F2D4|nr:hypothetical protein [Methanosarcina lacustris]